jgi:hypothetical protein
VLGAELAVLRGGEEVAARAEVVADGAEGLEELASRWDPDGTLQCAI